MKRVLALVALAVVLEAFRLALLARWIVYPDFLLGVVVLVSLSTKPPTGAFTGLALGAVRDLLYGGPVGTETLALTLVGAIVGSAGKAIYREAAITQGTAMLAGALGRSVFVYLSATELDFSGVFQYLLRVGFPSAVMTAVIVPLIYHFMPLIAVGSYRPFGPSGPFGGFFQPPGGSRALSEHEKKLLLERQ